MSKTLYLYAEPILKTLIEQIFDEFEIVDIVENHTFNHSFKNKNILMFIDKKIIGNLNKAFFLNNNIALIINKKNLFSSYHNYKAKKIETPVSIERFNNEVKNFFLFNPRFFKDIKVLDEKIINIYSKKTHQLTTIESKIFNSLIDHKTVSKDYVLEKILKLKKDIDTKTVESHLTRIRKKLQQIESRIEIALKDGDIFFNDYSR